MRASTRTVGAGRAGCAVALRHVPKCESRAGSVSGLADRARRPHLHEAARQVRAQVVGPLQRPVGALHLGLGRRARLLAEKRRAFMSDASGSRPGRNLRPRPGRIRPQRPASRRHGAAGRRSPLAAAGRHAAQQRQRLSARNERGGERGPPSRPPPPLTWATKDGSARTRRGRATAVTRTGPRAARHRLTGPRRGASAAAGPPPARTCILLPGRESASQVSAARAPVRVWAWEGGGQGQTRRARLRGTAAEDNKQNKQLSHDF